MFGILLCLACSKSANDQAKSKDAPTDSKAMDDGGSRSGGDDPSSPSAPTSGSDWRCDTSDDCDDGIDCTKDVCVPFAPDEPGTCTHEPQESKCEVGTFCLTHKGCVPTTACSDDDECGDDDGCTVDEHCEPSSRTCRYSVLDGDGDGIPPIICGGNDCDDSRASVRPGATETCNGLDDDCDGTVDDGLGLDLDTDPHNCGGCDIECESGTCEDGRCTDCGELGEACCSGSLCNQGVCTDGECANRSCDAPIEPAMPSCDVESAQCVEQCGRDLDCVRNDCPALISDEGCYECLTWGQLMLCGTHSGCDREANALRCCIEDNCLDDSTAPFSSSCAACDRVTAELLSCADDAGCADNQVLPACLPPVVEEPMPMNPGEPQPSDPVPEPPVPQPSTSASTPEPPSNGCSEACLGTSSCVRVVPVTYRDFEPSHPDFGPNPDACMRAVEDTGEVVTADALTTGLVADTLSAAGVPTLRASPGIQRCESVADRSSYTSITAFDEWFTDGPDRVTYDRELLLFPAADGAFVNRYTDTGEQWPGHRDEEWAESGEFTCSWCLDGDCADKCTGETVLFDGTPVFFPVDDNPRAGAPLPAKIPATYGYTAWPWEADVVRGDPKHNFYFTSVLRLESTYHRDAAASLQLLIHDDTWVFVNGVLAADLGGRHLPEAMAVTIGPGGPSNLGLVDGEKFEVLIFHANRNSESSSLLLRAVGFDSLASRCIAP